MKKYLNARSVKLLLICVVSGVVFYCMARMLPSYSQAREFEALWQRLQTAIRNHDLDTIKEILPDGGSPHCTIVNGSEGSAVELLTTSVKFVQTWWGCIHNQYNHISGKIYLTPRKYPDWYWGHADVKNGQIVYLKFP